MRRQTLVSLLSLAFLTSSGLLLAASTRGQPVSDFVSPKDTVYRYFDSILRPTLGERKSPPDDIVRAFYNAGLSDRTRQQVSENQFAEYWKDLAGRTARALLLIVDFKYSIDEPIESESHDQALILVTGTYRGLVATPAIVGCVSDMYRSSPDCTPRSYAESGDFAATYWIVREDNAWKLVLHDGLVREMQNLTRPVRRYRPNVAAAQAGLIIRVQEVTLQTEATTLRLLIENTNDVAAGFHNALSLASLTDDRGVKFNTRILRSIIPDTVPAHSSSVAHLTFVADLTKLEPVPVDARKLSLSLPYVRVRDSELTVALDIALRPLPLATVIRTSIPGEPVLVYLLTLFRPKYPTGDTLKTLYQMLLSSDTRGQVTEQEFVEYHQSASFDAVLCRLGVPDDFTIGVPTYTAPRQASIQVTTVRRGWLPPRIKPVTAVLTFRVVKEEDAWKLVLEQDFVKEIKEHSPLERRYHPNPAYGGVEDGVSINVNEVEVDTDETRVSLSIRNSNNRDISLTNYRDATNLRVEKEGWPYPLRRSWVFFSWSSGLPSVVQPTFGLPSVFVLVFDAIPLEARELWLTLGNFDTNKFSVGVEIVLDPESACP